MNTLQILDYGRVIVNGQKIFNCTEGTIEMTAGEITMATITFPIGETHYVR